MTVELIGAGKDEDGFNLVEVTGQKDSQGLIDKATKGILSIIEIEIYRQGK